MLKMENVKLLIQLIYYKVVMNMIQIKNVQHVKWI